MTEKRKGANWIDERRLERGDMRVVQGFAELRSKRVYDDAVSCEACTLERRESGDDEALCDAHLGQAFGMDSNWP